MSIVDKTLIDLINLADYHTKISAIIEANKNNLGSLILALAESLDTKQETLTSGTNIKTINGQSLLGSGDITIESSSNANCVHTYPNDYDFGFSISQIFDFYENGDPQITITYSDWEQNPYYIIYNWEKVCEFVYNIQDNSLITYSFDAYGGDKQLLFIDVETTGPEENTKILNIISVSTYYFKPVTLSIIMDNVSDFDRDTRLCQFTFALATDENLQVVTRADVENIVNNTLNGLTTRKFGD